MRTILAILETARQTTLQLLRHRLLLLVGIVLVGVPLLMLGISRARHTHGAATFLMVASTIYMSVLLPWTSMFLAVQAVYGDIEDRTFQFLFLRPVPRPALLLGKWLAAAVLTAAVMAAGALLLSWSLQATDLDWPEDLQPATLARRFAEAFVGGAFAYAAIGALLAARFRWPMIWSTAYIVGLEYAVAVLPPQAGVRSLAVVDALRRYLLDHLEVHGNGLRLLWPPEGKWRHDFVGHPESQVLWTIGLTVLLAAWVYRRSEYDSRQRE